MTGRARNPVGRRRAIVDAAVRAIAELGVAGATHRAIAARAGVPLGATTYYFPTLADLHAAALEQATEDCVAEVRSWTERLARSDDFAATLADLCTGYVDERDRATIEYELYVAAARDEALRPLARRWVDECTAMLSAFTTPADAATLAALIDGAVLQAVVVGQALDPAALADAIRRLVPRPKRSKPRARPPI